YGHIECVFLGVWFRDPWNIAGVLHPSVDHLHLYLSICLQGHQQHRLYSGQCGSKPGILSHSKEIPSKVCKESIFVMLLPTQKFLVYL
ncbi:hypothetical protein cypCar_00011609, partial [Cyprinus carpio]